MTAQASTATGNQGKAAKANGQQKGRSPRVITNPGDVASLVLMQIDAVNAKKDDLTIAVKGLADTAKQLVRAYAQQAAVIEKLARRVKDLEDKAKDK
jgi:cell division protein FtsB